MGEKASNAGIYLSDEFEILPDRFSMLLSGRYDYIVYKVKEETLPSRSDKRIFNAITPKLTLDFKITPWIALFTSFNLGFESPAEKELESADPFFLFNPTLKPQTSQNIDAGLKIDLARKDSSLFFRKFVFKATGFRNFVQNEMVPYEVFGEVFYRNASKTNHAGVEISSRLEIYKNLIFKFSYIYSRFIYESYETTSLETDSTGTVVEVPRDFSGKREPAVPESHLFMSLSYSHAAGKKADLSAKVSYTGLSGLWVNDANSEKTKSFNLLDAELECHLKFGHLAMDIAAGVNNILNSAYAGFVNSNSANGRFYDAGAPINYTGTLNFSYHF